jgi:PLP dependent protein
MAISSTMSNAFEDVRLRIPQTVKLVAVSKTYFAPDIKPVLNLGQRVFGENRVQEAFEKWPALRQEYSNIELHLIGPLQSNKAADAVALFDVIQTVDRVKIAQSLAKECAKQKRRPELFVQVNTGMEAQKAGIAPEEADKFISLCRNELALNVVGLMCIPPFDQDPKMHFKMLREIAQRNRIKELSMGMSSDFEIAITEGATVVRVGSAIFGKR